MTPRRQPWTACVHFPDSYPIVASQLSFNFLCLLFLCVSISMIFTLQAHAYAYTLYKRVHNVHMYRNVLSCEWTSTAGCLKKS